MVCPVCGKEFELRNKTQKYCSKKCVYEGHKKQVLEHYYRVKANPNLSYERVCPVCGVEFETRRATQKYCSEKCAYEVQKKYSREHYYRVKANPKPNLSYERVCPVCGVEFETRNETQKYCSKKCRQKGYFAENHAAINIQRKYHNITGKTLPLYKARAIVSEG